MSGQSYIEEIDCANFFDQIDDLIEFPSVTDTSLNSGDRNELTDVWTNNSGDFPVSDLIFNGSDNATALSAELDVPYEDIVQMEWLSNFVEDSFSGGGMTINTEKCPLQTETVVVNRQFQSSSPVSVLQSSSSSSNSSSSCSSSYAPNGSGKVHLVSPIQHGPQRARTKRPRPTSFNPRAMSDLLSPLVFIPISSPELEKNLTSRCGSNGSDSVTGEPEERKKKKQKKPKTDNENEEQTENQSGVGVRKCTHCEITKTPQWRAGPTGPKTLCNACGVRYKSGRLFPEYRPAASPSFVPTLHSNSHKKVVEMRTKFGPNEFVGMARTEPEPGLRMNVNRGPDSM